MSDLTELKICIVGAQGRMAKLFKQYWDGKLGGIYELDLVPGTGRMNSAEIEQTVPDADVTLLSVPICNFEAALAAIAPCLRPDTVLSDVSSVKTLPMELMQKYHSGPVVGTHPLFGPESFHPAVVSETGGLLHPTDNQENRFLKEEFQDRKNSVAVVPAQNCPKRALDIICALFRSAGCDTFVTTAAEHDRAIATIQSLNFLSNLAYFATAAALPDLAEYITPSFRRRLSAGRTMLQEDAGLFTNIARHTPHLQEAVQAYTRNLAAAGRLDDNSLHSLLALAGRYFK